MKRRLIQFLRVLFGVFHFAAATGQVSDTLFTIPDSARALTLQNFYELIFTHHPAARQASLLPEVARQEIRLARGNFDPKLEASYLTKTLNNKKYYTIFNGALKFPTVLPFDPSVGIDQNTGPYVNPERYIDSTFDYRQLYAGISLPLGRGLITDERRAMLRQAELFREMAEAEQVKIINDLLLDAARKYWDWYFTYYNYRLFNRSVAIAEEVFQRVQTNFTFGEASVIDTIQAKITWQQRIIEQREALVGFRNSGIGLSTFLWDSLGNPLDLDLTWVPVLTEDALTFTPELLKQLTDQARQNHPSLNKIEVKIEQLGVEKRLAVEYLKPRLDLNYYALNQPLSPDGAFSTDFAGNYKFGLDFSMPLFLRKERSKLALTKLKLTNSMLELSLIEREITNSIAALFNELSNLRPILSNQISMVGSYERLLQAELLNLAQGESDLFRINVQQEKLIQAQTKWLKLLSQNEKLKAHLYWAAGANRMN